MTRFERRKFQFQMRDHSRKTYSSTELTELIGVFRSGGHYFALIELTRNGVTKKIRFGILESGYTAMQSILQTRPLDTMSGVKYRYFDAQGYGNGITSDSNGQLIQGQPLMSVWIELHGKSLQRTFDVPIELLANLVWFSQLRDLCDVSHLTETAVRGC